MHARGGGDRRAEGSQTAHAACPQADHAMIAQRKEGECWAHRSQARNAALARSSAILSGARRAAPVPGWRRAAVAAADAALLLPAPLLLGDGLSELPSVVLAPLPAADMPPPTLCCSTMASPLLAEGITACCIYLPQKSNDRAASPAAFSAMCAAASFVQSCNSMLVFWHPSRCLHTKVGQHLAHCCHTSRCAYLSALRTCGAGLRS